MLIPATPTLRTRLAEIHRNAGEFEEPRNFSSKRCSIIPEFEEAQLGLGSVLMSLQKPDLALPHLLRGSHTGRGERSCMVSTVASARNVGE